MGEWTLLRLGRTHTATENVYRAWTSIDEGATWDEAGVWTTPLSGTPLSSTPPRLGLVSMAAAGFTTTFDYVRVYGERPGRGSGAAAADAALQPTVELAATGAPSAAVAPALVGLGLLGSGAGAWAATRLRTPGARSVRGR